MRKILVSQNTPANIAPYTSLKERLKVECVFRPFFRIEPLSSKEFRAQKINLPDYTAVVFSSRHAIDAYFQLGEELRFKVPETMKYFCTTEAVAMYLQKHIVYRKRKIFYGNATPESVLEQIGTKHSGETFLITTAENSKSDILTRLFDAKGLNYKTAVLIRSVSCDIKDLNFSDYDGVVVYNTADVASIFDNFPGFTQGEVKFISYGRSVVGAMEKAGLSISLKAPSPEAPSAAKAIELFLQRK